MDLLQMQNKLSAVLLLKQKHIQKQKQCEPVYRRVLALQSASQSENKNKNLTASKIYNTCSYQ